MKVADPKNRTRANPLDRFNCAVFCGIGRALARGGVHAEV
jgi:hypothetical protein